MDRLQIFEANDVLLRTQHVVHLCTLQNKVLKNLV
jgi:hypothetical protein